MDNNTSCLALISPSMSSEYTRRTTGSKLGSLTEIDEVYRYQLLVEAVMDYAIYLLDSEGYVHSWNPGAERFKGYRASEIIGQHFSCFYTEEDLAANVPAKALATAASEGRFEAEGWRVRKDGSRFWSSVVIDPIHNDAGKLLGFAKITRDITDHKLSADELLAARESLHQSQKLEALGLLTGGVAHDFNNLLMVIRGSAELLRRPDLSHDNRQRYIDTISSTADRAAHLTRQLLAYARKQPLRPATFDVRICIEGIEDLLKASNGSAIQIDYRIPSTPCTVRADRNQLETCILNIIFNARDAMPSGGSLLIAMTTVNAVSATQHHGRISGPHVEISITDTGSGIAPDIVDRVFEPFFTTKAPGHGTGLGLSQVFGFIKQSGGQLDIASELDAGTTVTLYLPAAIANGYEDLLSPQSDSLNEFQFIKHKVLLVEDNAEVRGIVTDLVRELGHDVMSAPDGHAALKILEQHNGAFDLVLADIVMPGINGMELAGQIQLQWPSIRVVLATGYSHALAKFASAEYVLLQKPYSIEALKEVIDTLGISRSAHDHHPVPPKKQKG